MRGLVTKGYNGCGINEILISAKVPKGSFYHYFESKEALAQTVLQRYSDQVWGQLNAVLSDESLSPVEAINAALAGARDSIVADAFASGCLLGTLAQELANLDVPMVPKMQQLFRTWEVLFRAALDRACACGELPPETDTASLAGFILNGWEGAVLRAKLDKSAAPLDQFLSHITRFLQLLG